MILSQVDTLAGFATFQQTILHTYVESKGGGSWGCWGGTVGGTQICFGPGSSLHADCIDGKDNAGIIYWVTGVCHQIANRILAPAGIILPSNAHADIAGSYFLYGEWGQHIPGLGTANWPSRYNYCLTQIGSSTPSSGLSQPQLSGGGSNGGPMSFHISRGGQPDRRTRLSAMIRAGLGHSVDDKICDALAEMQRGLQARQTELAELMLENKISREKYLRDLDEAMRTAAAVGEDLLGRDDFHKVFGEFRVHKFGDTAKFIAEEHKPNH